MNSPVPKQFLPLAGKPVAMHSMIAFHNAFPEIFLVLVLPGNLFGVWQDLCQKYAFILPHKLVAGGETRFHSVQNALPALPGEGLVAIHDGARPLISEILIRRIFHSAELWGNSVPAVPVTESIRRISGETSIPVDRNTLRSIQTPQVFKVEMIRKGYQQDYQPQFTDDATVLESIGETIQLVDGDPSNIKITNPCDLAMAEILLIQASS